MSFAEAPIDLVQAACEAAIASIERERERRARENAACPWWRAKPWHEFSIACYAGSQEMRCERLISLCRVARKAGRDSIKVSAEDADSFQPFISD